MPRLRSGSDMWSIARDGATLTIVDAGKQTTRKFVSDHHAKVQHDKLVADKLAGGWQLTDEPIVASAGEPTEPALELALASNPYDAQVAAVYGDWYQSHGHPRGELIARGLAAARDSTDKAPAAVRKHLARHREVLLGELARYDAPGDDSPFTWRHGFIRRLDLTDASDAVALVLAVLAHPSGRFLTEARLRFNGALELVATLEALRPARLRELAVLTHSAPAHFDMLASFTQLRKLAVYCSAERSTIAQTIAFAGIVQMPATVEALALHISASQARALAPLLARDDLQISELSLELGESIHTVIDALADGPLAARLVALDLADDPELWVRAFREYRARFAKLELLELLVGHMAPSALAALRASVARVLPRRDANASLMPELDEYFDEVRE